jgi:hypothetical protein
LEASSQQAKSVKTFENWLGRGLVFESADRGREVIYLGFKDKDFALKFLKLEGKLPNRLVRR